MGCVFFKIIEESSYSHFFYLCMLKSNYFRLLLILFLLTIKKINALDAFLTAVPSTTTTTTNKIYGLNEPWIMEYLLQLNVPCDACPTNVQKRTLEEIKCRLSDLVLNQNVGVFREILPFQLLQPVQNFNNSANY